MKNTAIFAFAAKISAEMICVRAKRALRGFYAPFCACFCPLEGVN